MVSFNLAVLLLAFDHVFSMTGYDCGKQYNSYKTYSATSVEECPDFQDWIPKMEPVKAQILRSTDRDTIEVEECKILETHIVDYCGQFNAISYGSSVQVETNKYYRMSHQDCRRLIQTGDMVYR